MNRRSFLKLLGITPVVSGVLADLQLCPKETPTLDSDLVNNSYIENHARWDWGHDKDFTVSYAVASVREDDKWRILSVQEVPFTGQQIDMYRYTDLVNRS
jgi:hypothetical protein